MITLYGLMRLAASLVAFLGGAWAVPMIALAIAIPLHATFSFLVERSLQANVQDRPDTPLMAAARRPLIVRALAFAFAKCAMACIAGFFLAQLFAAPAPPA